ncbi:MAG: O-antigen polymerase [Paraclostridium sp.]
MSAVVGLLQLISIVVVIFYEYTKKYISVFMWGTLLILFGVPHFIAILFNKYEYNEEVMIQASIFVILFNLVYLVSRIIISSIINTKTKSDNNLDMDNYTNKKIVKLLFITLLICIFILLFYSRKYLGGIFNASWGGFYNLNQELGSRNLLRYTQFLFFASAGVVLIFKQKKRKVLFCIASIIIILYSTITGNRITILPLLVSIILPFIYDNKKVISIKNIVILIILGIVAVYLVYFFRLLRIYGGMSEILSSLSLQSINSLVIDMILSGDGELSLRNAFYHFIQYNNEFPNFNEGHTYLRLLFMIIPSSLLGGMKPPDFAISMGSAWTYDFQNTTFSMHPTLYGDVFANFYWGGIIWAIFWAIFNVVVEKIINRKNRVVKNVLQVLLGTVFIIIARGSVYNSIFIGVVGFIIISLIYWLSRIKISDI